MSSKGSSGRNARQLSGLELDRVIHERARLVLLTYLASSDKAETSFTELRDTLALTAGNLSVQLRTLEEAGYVKIEKRFVGNKPFTGVRLTVKGEKAITAYLENLEVILTALRGGTPAGSRGGTPAEK
jgi:DNA-binding MarR family transcriptional regulator